MNPKWIMLTRKQKEWVKHKARWEHMTLGAVLDEWMPPDDEELCLHGATACLPCLEGGYWRRLDEERFAAIPDPEAQV